MTAGLADQTLNSGVGSFNFLPLEQVAQPDGKAIFQKSLNGQTLTFQQLPNGSYKFDVVASPGAWEKANVSNGVVAVFTPADGVIYARLLVHP